MHAGEFGQMMHFHLWRWRESIKSLSLFGGEAVWKICTYNTFTFNFCQATSKFTVRKNYSDEKFTFCQSRSKLTERKNCFDETFTLYEKVILMTLSLSLSAQQGAEKLYEKSDSDDRCQLSLGQGRRAITPANLNNAHSNCNLFKCICKILVIYVKCTSLPKTSQEANAPGLDLKIEKIWQIKKKEFYIIKTKIYIKQ